MKYIGMPLGMWLLFKRSFRGSLISVLGHSEQEADAIASSARLKYREIIAGLPEFEKADLFKKNIVNCALLSAFLLNMEKKPSVDRAADFYEHAMTTKLLKWFCRKAGKKRFSNNNIRNLQEAAALNAADRNPYSWNMKLLPYPDGSGYEARFTACGICTLMKELGLWEFVPAMCRMDYTLNDIGGTSDFVREYTLASGGPYCDNGYKKKQ